MSHYLGEVVHLGMIYSTVLLQVLVFSNSAIISVFTVVVVASNALSKPMFLELKLRSVGCIIRVVLKRCFVLSKVQNSK